MYDQVDVDGRQVGQAQPAVGLVPVQDGVERLQDVVGRPAGVVDLEGAGDHAADDDLPDVLAVGARERRDVPVPGRVDGPQHRQDLLTQRGGRAVLPTRLYMPSDQERHAVGGAGADVVLGQLAVDAFSGGAQHDGERQVEPRGEGTPQRCGVDPGVGGDPVGQGGHGHAARAVLGEQARCAVQNGSRRAQHVRGDIGRHMKVSRRSWCRREGEGGAGSIRGESFSSLTLGGRRNA